MPILLPFLLLSGQLGLSLKYMTKMLNILIPVLSKLCKTHPLYLKPPSFMIFS